MGFEKKDNQHFYNPVRQAVMDFHMIEPGDKIALGMSGGKDSTTLLYLLDTILKQKRLGFDDVTLVPIMLDMGYESVDPTPLQELCDKLGYKLEIVPTQIAPILFDVRQEKNPCSLCANLRRGILYDTAVKMGCKKVALGHHLDDAVETFVMNLLFHGEMRSFQPVTHLDRTDITLIRPLLYVEEQDIKRFVKRENLPVIFNPCPMDKKTKREEVKNFVSSLEAQYPQFKKRVVQCLERPERAQFWDKA